MEIKFQILSELHFLNYSGDNLGEFLHFINLSLSCMEKKPVDVIEYIYLKLYPY